MFKLNKDAKNWAETLTAKDSPIRTQMDIYYLSLVVGIGKNQCPTFQENQVTEITRSYTEKFLPLKDLLAGVLLAAEITNFGLPAENKIIRKKVSELFNSTSPTSLSDNAINIMNRYAFGGFELMKRELTKAPPVHDFLVWYNDEILSDCFPASAWSSS